MSKYQQSRLNESDFRQDCSIDGHFYVGRKGRVLINKADDRRLWEEQFARKATRNFLSLPLYTNFMLHVFDEAHNEVRILVCAHPGPINN